MIDKESTTKTRKGKATGIKEMKTLQPTTKIDKGLATTIKDKGIEDLRPHHYV